MIKANPHFEKIAASYLFVDIARRVENFRREHPGTPIIRMGIGDVTEPLPEACLEAFHRGVDEMGKADSFRGYGPEKGYDFLREAIAKHDFQARGLSVSADEIFVSDGSKCDTGNFQELFAAETKVAVPDPVYPVYVDTNVMAGRTGPAGDSGRYPGLVYLESTPENGYLAELPSEPVDLIYLCFPNNPTGAVATHDYLKKWVDYARENKAVILYDAAYEAFIRDDSLPRSIYEIEGAREVAVEFRSFSKNAGFTGTRCAFTVVPDSLMITGGNGAPRALKDLWNRRHSTKFNGVSYPVQKAAEAVYSSAGREQTRKLADGYLANAAKIRECFQKLGVGCVGGDHSPYVWIHSGRDSWETFDHLLNKAGVVCTPGAGFGQCGQGHIRLSAFNSPDKVEEALERIQKIW